MFRKPSFEARLEQLGKALLEAPTIKAVMMSKNEDGDVIITFVEGTEESHKVKFGRVDRCSGSLSRHHARTAMREPSESPGARHRRIASDHAAVALTEAVMLPPASRVRARPKPGRSRRWRQSTAASERPTQVMLSRERQRRLGRQDRR